MKEAIGYVRVSTEKQVKEGVSLNAQEEKIKAYCVLNDLQLLRVFKDEGISGSKRRRAGLIKAMKAVKEVKGVLVVYSLSRFSRSVKDCTDLSEELSKGGCNFVSLTEKIDTGTAMGRFFFHVMSALGALERELTIERLKSTQDYKRTRMQRMGRFRPYGYNVVEGGEKNAKGASINILEPIDSEQDIISRIVDEHDAGKKYAIIAEELNDDGVPSARNAKWHAKTVRSVYLREKKRQGDEDGKMESQSSEHVLPVRNEVQLSVQNEDKEITREQSRGRGWNVHSRDSETEEQEGDHRSGSDSAVPGAVHGSDIRTVGRVDESEKSIGRK